MRIRNTRRNLQAVASSAPTLLTPLRPVRRNAGMSERFQTNVRRAFTVLELLVTMSLIVLLIGLIFPAIQVARESSRQLHCSNNLRQISLALQNRHDTFGALPAGWTGLSDRPVHGPDEDQTAWGWAVDVLPFFEQNALHVQIDRSSPVSSSSNEFVRGQRPAFLLCPSDSAVPFFDLYAGTEVRGAHGASGDSVGEPRILVSLPQSNYVGVFGVSDPDDAGDRAGEGTFIAERPISFRDLTRGLSNVATVGERTARRLPATWLGVDLRGEDAQARLTGFAFLGPNRIDADECELDSRHHQSVNMAFADGHVRRIANEVDRVVYQGMAKRSE